MSCASNPSELHTEISESPHPFHCAVEVHRLRPHIIGMMKETVTSQKRDEPAALIINIPGFSKGSLCQPGFNVGLQMFRSKVGRGLSLGQFI